MESFFRVFKIFLAHKLKNPPDCFTSQEDLIYLKTIIIVSDL